jgi:hypothetical protein
MPEPKPAIHRLLLRWRAARRSPIYRALSWLVPIALAIMAVGLQYNYDVPRSEMLPRPDSKAKKKKKKRDRARRRRARLRSQKWEARSPTRVARLRQSWMTRELADEPIDNRFKRHHDALLRAAVSLARREAIGSRVVAIRTMPACRTIRCSIELCGPTSAIDEIAEQLPKVELEDGPLWHSFEEEPPTRDPGEPRPVAGSDEPPEPNICRRWLVTFEDDAPRRSQLRMPEAEEKDDDGKAKGKPKPKAPGARPRDGDPTRGR